MANSTLSTLTLTYPKHYMNPEDLLGFVEIKPFTAAWEALRLTDEDLAVAIIYHDWAENSAGHSGDRRIEEGQVCPEKMGKREERRASSLLRLFRGIRRRVARPGIR